MHKLAECIGLWLAEGDNKTTAEITFTNNCQELINFFYKTISSQFKNYKFNPRIYVYYKNKVKTDRFYKNCQINYYIDKRANKPYYIFRLASVKIVKKWYNLINNLLDKKELQADILRGFFAGEGNIKSSTHNHRSIRIFQNKKKKFIDNILKFYKINYQYLNKEKCYYISGRKNWDKLANIKIANLHPIKRQKFWKIYKNFKEYHYKHNHLKKQILKILGKSFTTKELAKKFNRSQARIAEILVDLKKQNKAKNFRVGSLSYWTNKNTIIISRLKYRYLQLLNQPRTTTEIAKLFKVCHKSSFRRLEELKKLKLVKRQKNKKWIKIPIQKKMEVY